MAKLKVGINGFGRIGRILFRAGFEELDIVGINNLSSPKDAAHLLKYDSTHGKYKNEVTSGENFMTVAGQKVNFSHERDPANIPWKEWGVDVVLECTGVFKHKEDLLKHKTAGAKKVLVSAPAPGADLTIVYGINHEQYSPESHDILSNASCTTNCLAPLAKVINDKFGIENAFMTTIHSYTNDQRILDSSHKDLRRARAAAVSMIPTTTGAAVAVGKVLPELDGKINGLAVRVPTPNVSLVDLVAQVREDVDIEKINNALIEAADSNFKGVLRCESDPLVSTDFIGDQYSSVIDLPSTMVMGPKMLKVFSWYDNEMGFSSRMIDLAKYMQGKGL